MSGAAARTGKLRKNKNIKKSTKERGGARLKINEQHIEQEKKLKNYRYRDTRVK